MTNAETFISSMYEDDSWNIDAICQICDEDFENEVGGWVDTDGTSACWDCMWMIHGVSSSEESKQTENHD